MNIKEKAKEEFDEKFPYITADEPHSDSMVCEMERPKANTISIGKTLFRGDKEIRKAIKQFIDQSIDIAQEEERKRIMNAIVKNVDMTDEQLQDILGLLTNK